MKNREEIVKSIMDETKKSIPQIANYRVGSVFRLFIEVVASFLEKLYSELDHMLPNRFIQTAKGEFLDLKAEELSLIRHPATKARGIVIFKREESVSPITISTDKIVATKPTIQGTVLKYNVIENVTMSIGQLECEVWVEAEFEGKSYSVVENQIVDLITPMVDIESVSNNAGWMLGEGVEGRNKESDDELRFRCIALWRGLSGANKESYIYWAKSINGVEDVRVLYEELGKTKIIFTTTNNTIPNTETIAKVKEHIERLKPIATALTVEAPVRQFIDMNIDVEFLPYVDLGTEDIEGIEDDIESSKKNEAKENEIRTAVKTYFAQLKIGYDFVSSALSKHIFKQCIGVKSVKINNILATIEQNSATVIEGPIEQVTITEGQIATIGDNITIVMSVSEEQ